MPLHKSNWWGDISILAVGRADDLSLKDETDSSRIPPNGTPGYALVGISGGRQWVREFIRFPCGGKLGRC